MILNICKLGALMIVVGNCSFTMRRVDPDWDRKREPVCTDSYQPVLVDSLIAASVLGAVTQDAQAYKPELNAGALAAAGAVWLVFTASAALGATTYNDCRAARAEWFTQEAIRQSNTKSAAPANGGVITTSSAPAVANAPAAVDASSASKPPATPARPDPSRTPTPIAPSAPPPSAPAARTGPTPPAAPAAPAGPVDSAAPSAPVVPGVPNASAERSR